MMGEIGSAIQAQRAQASTEALIKIAAECHRTKWKYADQWDSRPFDDIHRIGDMAMKMLSNDQKEIDELQREALAAFVRAYGLTDCGSKLLDDAYTLAKKAMSGGKPPS